MASRKRSRHSEDIDGDVEVESASSSLRQTAHKRPRAVLAAERGGSTVSDEDDDENGDGISTDGLHSRFSSEIPSEIPGDSDPDDEEDDELNELRGTQFVQRQFRQLKENVAMENGIIEEVFCRNFMCHSKLRVKLGPLINFIIGHNGSGKSAVLTALTMCLGGKANATNRGSNLKSMIKEGEESAALAVKIKNAGEGAYRPEFYGRSITVERHFSRSGASGFKIKNAEDKIISTKKSDLDDIIDFFALQLDNPINVLNQDMARQFLSNSTPTEKYKFFIRGTQLETLDADYKLLEEHLDNIEAKLISREDDLAVYRSKADEAEKRKKRIDASASIEKRHRQAVLMHAWIQVEGQEEILRRYEEDMATAANTIEDATQEVETAGGEYEGHNQSHEQVKRLADDLAQQYGPVESNYHIEKEKFEAGKNKLIEHQTQKRHAKDDHKTAQTTRENLEQQVSEEQLRLANAGGPEHTARLERLERLKQNAAQAKEVSLGHQASHVALEQKKNEASKAVDDAQQHVDDQGRVVEKAEGVLSRMRKEQNQQFSAYKPNMERLVRAVNSETRWRSKPVGPVGAHVRLIKPEWTGLVERTFGAVLESFVVTCRDDQMLLGDIMKRQSCSCNIIIGDPAPLDTAGKEPEPGVDTILRILQINNDLVRNQLIINQAIEQTVLISDRQKAHDYMYRGARPHNVRAVIAFDGGRHGGGVRFDFTRSGASKSGSVSAWAGASRMQTNREEQIKSQCENAAQANRELDSLRQELRSRKVALETAKQDLVRYKKRRQELLAEEQGFSDQVDAVQEEIEKNTARDGKLQELQNQLKAAEEDEEHNQRMVEDLIAAKVNLDDAQKEAKARMDATFAESEAYKARLDNANKQVERLGDIRATSLRKKNAAIAAIAEAEAELQRRTTMRDNQQRKLDEEYIQNAESLGQRVPIEPGVTCASLDRRIDRLVEEQERCQREAGGSRAELTEAWKKAKGELYAAERQCKEMKRVASQLKGSLAERQRRWRKFRKYIGYRARNNFSYLLSERQFRGRVVLDHQDKMLDIKVEPDLSKVSDAGREAKTLSGGEKSFSTICLLLSIWEAMGSPIRCLDEFDVFMDSVNRATSMTMMIQAARRSVGRQYILITPQSMQNVQLGDDVKIHRMSDPERGQAALPFTQA